VHPTLLELGPLRVSSFGFFLLLAFAVGILVLVREAREEGWDPGQAVDLALSGLIGGILGARVGYVVVHWSAFAGDPGRLVQFWQDGGLVFYGALLGGVGACAIAAGPASVARFADLAARPLCIGYAIGMVGALLAGAFSGRPSDVPWGVEVGGALRHPTQVYLLLGSLGIFRVLRSVRAHRSSPGQVFLAFLVLYGITRFTVEFFLDPEVAPPAIGPLTLAQVVNGIVASLALVLLVLGRRSLPSAHDLGLGEGP
jgi:phosphatidylglycerol:prolipoprotein diacylglycerol transferase